MISFRLPIIPPRSTSQGKRMAVINGKPMFFKKKEHQQAENDLLTLCAPHAPPFPLMGPVFLQVEFVFPWRKSETVKNMRYPKIWHTTIPDLDNSAKLICDVLTKLQFYRDDGQVADLRLTKYWGATPGITITIGEL